MTPDEKHHYLAEINRLQAERDEARHPCEACVLELSQARAMIRELCGALENIDQVLDGYCTDDCDGETGEPMRLVDYCTYCLIEKDIDAALARVPVEWRK